MKVVLDNNVLVSAFLWQKQLKPIYFAIKNGDIIPCFTQETWQELQRVLKYPKLKSQIEKSSITAEETLGMIAAQGHFVESPIEIPTIIKEDSSDNHLLACVVVSQAQFIISGDQHLLKLKQFQNIPILTPRQFLNQVEK